MAEDALDRAWSDWLGSSDELFSDIKMWNQVPDQWCFALALNSISMSELRDPTAVAAFALRKIQALSTLLRSSRARGRLELVLGYGTDILGFLHSQHDYLDPRLAPKLDMAIGNLKYLVAVTSNACVEDDETPPASGEEADVGNPAVVEDADRGDVFEEPPEDGMPRDDPEEHLDEVGP